MLVYFDTSYLIFHEDLSVIYREFTIENYIYKLYHSA